MAEQLIHCEFEDIIASIINTVSHGKHKFETAQKILNMSPEYEKSIDISKELVSRVSCRKRNLPKKYYLCLVDKEFKEEFFENLRNILNQCELDDSQIISNIADDVSKYKPSNKNDGNGVEYIIAALREKLEDRLLAMTYSVRLQKNNLPKRSYFFGRRDEIFELSEAIKSNGYAVLSGLPGIGKTEIALNYALSSEEYAYKFRVQYQGSLEKTLVYIIKEYSFNKEIAELPNAYNIALFNLNKLGNKLLIIIDGMNEDFRNNISFADEFKKYHFHFIITTRSRFENAVYVTFLPYVYCKKIVEEMGCKSYIIEGDLENYNSICNPFLFALYYLNQKQLGEKSDSEFSYKPYDYLGKQRLSYPAWLNRLYDFKKMSEEEQHVLKFLSVFALSTYTLRFINTVCPMCTLKRIERLFNLGWINFWGKNVFGEICYVNGYSWWQYYDSQGLDASEFEIEMQQIMQRYDCDFHNVGKIQYDLEIYGLLADKINGTSQEWNDFRNKVAEQLIRVNPTLAYNIMEKTGTDLEHIAEETKKLVNQLSKESSGEFVCKTDSDNILKKKEYFVNNLPVQLKKDLKNIDELANKSINCLLFNEIEAAYQHKEQMLQLVERYASINNMTETFVRDYHALHEFIINVSNSTKFDDNPLYKNLKSFCDTNNAKMPCDGDIQEFIEHMPMIHNLNRIVGLVNYVESYPELYWSDGYITKRIEELSKYGKEKYPRYQKLFYDALALCCIIRGSFTWAENCLNFANDVIPTCDSDADWMIHSVISSVIDKEIKLSRFWESNDKIGSEFIGFLENCILEVTDFNGNGLFRSIVTTLLCKYVLRWSKGRIDEKLIRETEAKMNSSINRMKDAGFADIDFNLISKLDNNNQPSN